MIDYSQQKVQLNPLSGENIQIILAGHSNPLIMTKWGMHGTAFKAKRGGKESSRCAGRLYVYVTVYLIPQYPTNVYIYMYLLSTPCSAEIVSSIPTYLPSLCPLKFNRYIFIGIIFACIWSHSCVALFRHRSASHVPDADLCKPLFS